MSGISTLCSMTVRYVSSFVADEGGTTAIEYALIAAGVGAAIAATVYSLGSSVKTTLYDKIDGAF